MKRARRGQSPPRLTLLFVLSMVVFMYLVLVWFSPQPPPPLHVEEDNGSKSYNGAMSCNRLQSVLEDKMVMGFRSLFTAKQLDSVFLSLSTKDTLPALQIQLDSLRENAPKMLSKFIVVCVGNDTCIQCEGMHPGQCVPDEYLADFLQGVTGANSLSHKSSSGLAKAYVDIIWRKPELILLAFQAGAKFVGVVDTDGVWFSNPPFGYDTNMSIQASSEHGQPANYLVTQSRCNRASIFRGSPLILNSGTVLMRNDFMGQQFLQDWLAFRATNAIGLCGETNTEVGRESAMLDQDGMNSVACLEGKPYSNQVVGLSSNQVLLNAIHNRIRGQDWYSICRPWFFHATNCGGTGDKHVCLERNLQRHRDARCDQT
ncbi:hypothetical protein BASA81_003670 [Batrachochytrium salamandrivorans]|nr:hypothetical protein BASA81_003670 [Batrachochytrium salamandrivorans]